MPVRPPRIFRVLCTGAMAKEHSSLIRGCLALLLEPVADFCVARGLHFQDFVELAKASFAGAAARRLQADGKAVTTSKLSVMTGIQRPEIKRLHVRGVA